jgi:hypothetical protein
VPAHPQRHMYGEAGRKRRPRAVGLSVVIRKPALDGAGDAGAFPVDSSATREQTIPITELTTGKPRRLSRVASVENCGGFRGRDPRGAHDGRGYSRAKHDALAPPPPVPSKSAASRDPSLRTISCDTATRGSSTHARCLAQLRGRRWILGRPASDRWSRVAPNQVTSSGPGMVRGSAVVVFAICS